MLAAFGICDGRDYFPCPSRPILVRHPLHRLEVTIGVEFRDLDSIGNDASVATAAGVVRGEQPDATTHARRKRLFHQLSEFAPAHAR
jgi:hypothetical protein